MTQNKKIDSFSGQHRFLSNFWFVEVKLDDQPYPTVEHAYQAAKTNVKNEREGVYWAGSPGEAKRRGRKVTITSDWDQRKDSVMLDLLRQKFKNDELRDKLFRTGDAELVEGNHWNDTYWGVCNGVGQNKLGKLLMQVRDEINA